MVPYVRKSFYKYFLDGMKYIEKIHIQLNIEDIKETSIEWFKYKEYKKAYNYAIDMTERELQQAVEGMYHNLEIWA